MAWAGLTDVLNWRVPSSDEPREELERLLGAERQRKAQNLAELAASLSEAPVVLEDEIAEPRRPRRREPQPEPLLSDELPFGIQLPKRTTHGGPFGPKVRRKLMAEAMRYRW
jgi:hypothetical protein